MPSTQTSNATPVRHCVRCGRATELGRCPVDQAPTVVAQPRYREELDAGTVIAERYEIVDKLAAGGYDTIYRARHATTGHHIALKVMEPLPGDDLVTTARRFFREAAATARLGHPNTVRVFDFGQTDYGELYLAMELLKGRSVAARLQRTVRRGRVMTPRMVGIIGVGVLRSLGEAHAMGIVHRDLKPENVILHEAGPADLAVKVVDFGVARDTAAPMTRPGTVIGTATHMAPEQVTGNDEVDHRADLCAVGVMLYECITGHLPFQADNSYMMAMAHVIDEPPPVSDTVPGLKDSALEQVIAKALAKKPAERWQTALQMRRALLKAIDKEDLFMIDEAFQSSMFAAEELEAADRQGRENTEFAGSSLPPDERPTQRDGQQAPVSSAPAQRGNPLRMPSFAPRKKGGE